MCRLSASTASAGSKARDPAAHRDCSGLTGDITSAALACDAFDRSCQRACATDADCAQLPGFACDLRVASDYFEGDVPTGLDPGAIRGFCFDPSCAR